MNAAQFRKLALSLPNTEEGSHMGHADFRVGGKIFASLTEDETKASFKLPLELQLTLIDDESFAGQFAPAAGAWGRSGWTYAHLAKVTATVMRALLEDAYTLVSKVTAKGKVAAKAKVAARGKGSAKGKGKGVAKGRVAAKSKVATPAKVAAKSAAPAKGAAPAKPKVAAPRRSR
ncbi:MAG: MmcQ/YjbR family DNA-binding protein [Labilithrix sp.]|nr:MmcQ/YjbR family DNA-binding protein [Labilithrix sp.]MCW5813268.1 MmcQ/YjbR family DNA-binding protein [Labilithrix sp.]